MWCECPLSSEQASESADPIAFMDATVLHPEGNVNKSLLNSSLPVAMLRWHQFAASWTGCPALPFADDSPLLATACDVSRE